MEDFAKLRILLAQAPSEEGWQQLIELLEQWPEGDSLQLAQDYAKSHLKSWPDELRTARIQRDAPDRNWELARILDVHINRTTWQDLQEHLSFTGSCWHQLRVNISGESSFRTIPVDFVPSKTKHVAIHFPHSTGSSTLTWNDTLLRHLAAETNMQSLFLQSSQEQLPESIYSIKTLKHLAISDAFLLSLSSDISNLINLRSLYLTASHLISIPRSLGKLSKLRELHLDTHSLERIPNTITSLTNLQSFSLTTRSLYFHDWDPAECHDVPPKYSQSLEELFELLSLLPFLQKLRLADYSPYHVNSEVHNIPTSIGNMQALRELDIQSISWSWLPETIVELEYLEKIWLRKYQYENHAQNLQILFPEGSFVGEEYTSYFSTGR